MVFAQEHTDLDPKCKGILADSSRSGFASRFHMEESSWAGPFCFKADMWSSFCLLHLSKEHPESVAMGAVHKVDSNVLGPDSATLSRCAAIACEY